MFLNVAEVRAQKAPSVRAREAPGAEQTKLGSGWGGSRTAGGGRWFVHPRHHYLIVGMIPKGDKSIPKDWCERDPRASQHRVLCKSPGDPHP